jgi:hypothetical protein
VHCIEQPPTQLDIVQLAPLHGTEQLPDWLQSTLHTDPGPQVVWQLPACGSLQSTLQADWAAHSVLQFPLGHPTAHDGDWDVQTKSQVAVEIPADKRQSHAVPAHEQSPPGSLGSGAHVNPVAPPPSRASAPVVSP